MGSHPERRRDSRDNRTPSYRFAEILSAQRAPVGRSAVGLRQTVNLSSGFHAGYSFPADPYRLLPRGSYAARMGLPGCPETRGQTKTQQLHGGKGVASGGSSIAAGTL